LQLLGESAGITYAKLGLLGSGISLVGASFAGWKIGEWIEHNFHLSESIGRISAKLGELVGSAARGYVEAIRRNIGCAESYSRRIKAQAAAIDPLVVQFKALVAQYDEAGKKGKMSAETLDAFIKQAAELKAKGLDTKELDAFIDKLKKMAEAVKNVPVDPLADKIAKMLTSLTEAGDKAAIFAGAFAKLSDAQLANQDIVTPLISRINELGNTYGNVTGRMLSVYERTMENNRARAEEGANYIRLTATSRDYVTVSQQIGRSEEEIARHLHTSVEALKLYESEQQKRIATDKSATELRLAQMKNEGASEIQLAKTRIESETAALLFANNTAKQSDEERAANERSIMEKATESIRSLYLNTDALAKNSRDTLEETLQGANETYNTMVAENEKRLKETLGARVKYNDEAMNAARGKIDETRAALDNFDQTASNAFSGLTVGASGLDASVNNIGNTATTVAAKVASSTATMNSALASTETITKKISEGFVAIGVSAKHAADMEAAAAQAAQTGLMIIPSTADYYGSGPQAGPPAPFISGIPPSAPSSGGGYSTPVISFPGLANGGPAYPGRSYRVGESGEEIFSPSVSGIVGPTQSGITIHIDGRGGFYDSPSGQQAFADRVGKAVEARLKAMGARM
jgi:hypothetical protein